MPKATDKSKGGTSADEATKVAGDYTLLDDDLFSASGKAEPRGEGGSDTIPMPATGLSTFSGPLADYLSASKKEEEDRRNALESIDLQTQRRINRLRRDRATVTCRDNMPFDDRLKSLLGAFRVGEETGPDAESVRKSKTALAIKCVASEKARNDVVRDIDKRIRSLDDNLSSKKREYFNFLCKELPAREKMWNEARTKEVNLMSEYENLKKKFEGKEDAEIYLEDDTAYERYTLIKEIVQAQKNLEDYQQTGRTPLRERTQASRKRIEAPSADGSDAKKVRVHNSKKKSDFEIIDQASASVTRFCVDWQMTVHGRDIAHSEDATGAPTLPGVNDDPRFVHENQLLSALWPNALKTPSWNSVKPAAEPEDATLDHIHARQSHIIATIQEIQSIQHAHSLAMCNILDAVAAVRLAVARDGQQQEALAKELASAQRATLLGSDPDLKNLPFRSLPQIHEFFKSADRISKLAKYLCTYVKYTNRYAADLNDALLHPDLQQVVYWPGTRLRG